MKFATERVRGADLAPGDVVSLWFNPAARLLVVEPYQGPMAHLFPAGAVVGTFTASTPRGVAPMTIDLSAEFDRVPRVLPVPL